MIATELDSATILIVDDNPTNLKVLSDAIVDSGWVILVATDGETAIEQAEYAKPDLILLDVMMPGIDGFETCRRLKDIETTSDIPIIFMTALSNTEDKIKGFNLGAVDYITKPFQQEEVIARVQVHLKLRSLSRQLAQQNQLLEEKVSERTSALQTTLKELQESQLQLVQGEKMATLGQLVAGVAHEINNPVGFIAGNLHHAEEDINNLIELVELYQQEYPEPPEKIADLIEDIDLEFVCEDLPQMIQSMREGTKRIRNISVSLTTFSRSDHAAKVPFDLHEGIDSTLLILKHRLKANERRPAIEIIKEFGQLPEVKCFPGQINQVFMNLIANAIDAVEETNEGRSYDEVEKNPNRIILHTEVKGENAVISIKDNGKGMTDEVKDKVFDHLFTTKPVGKGTGLGLSISRQIITEKHGGKILCETAPGEGTVFAIEIPLE